ncbi:MAG: methyltransferase domain-containing protein [Gammaproteobacteria bacterium]|nr:methyltransferase domain-containing protein [Gammaproteobacteria bacterium]
MHVSDYEAYQKIITDSYNERSKVYAQSKWHRSLAEQLVDYYPPRNGDSVLDVGTGTGSAAFRCCDLTGKTGRVLGIDISRGMISEAQKIKAESECDGLEFRIADGEALDFDDNSFDRIYCASAFFWIADKQKALTNWYRMLKSGGVLGFHAWPETSYISGYIARKVLKNHGIEYLAHSPTGSHQICEQLLKSAGFTHIDIKEVSEGHFLSLEDAKDAWVTEEHYPLGQYPHPVSVTPEETLKQAKLDYDVEMEKLATEKGVWNDTSIYYVYGLK